MGPALRSWINTDPSTPWRCKGDGASGLQGLRVAPRASARLSAGPCAELDRGPRCALDPAGTEGAVQLKDVCVRQKHHQGPPRFHSPGCTCRHLSLQLGIRCVWHLSLQGPGDPAGTRLCHRRLPALTCHWRFGPGPGSLSFSGCFHSRSSSSLSRWGPP